jgi:hypothetical protein
VSPHQIYDDEDTDEHQEARDERISDIDYEIEEIKDIITSNTKIN